MTELWPFKAEQSSLADCMSSLFALSAFLGHFDKNNMHASVKVRFLAHAWSE